MNSLLQFLKEEAEKKGFTVVLPTSETDRAILISSFGRSAFVSSVSEIYFFYYTMEVV